MSEFAIERWLAFHPFEQALIMIIILEVGIIIDLIQKL